VSDWTPVGRLLLERAAACPERLFLWCGDERATYADVADRSLRLAGGLSQAGVGEGDRVIVVSANRLEVLLTFFAVAHLGAIYVPLNAFLKGDFLRYQLQDSGAGIALVDAPAEAALQSLASELPELRTVVAYDAPAEGSISLTDLLSAAALKEACERRSTDILSILYTSGTTGMPKGCMLSQGYYRYSGQLLCASSDIDADDRLFTTMPLFHAAAGILALMAALEGGGSMAVDAEFSASSFMARAAEVEATIATGVGVMGQAMLAQPEGPADRSHRLRSISLIPMAAEAQAAFEARFGVPVVGEVYGQTEGAPVSLTSIKDPERDRSSAGRPVAALEVAIVDDDDRAAPVGEVGEIVVRPREPNVIFSGYWNKPETTLAAFRNLWYHTGDYGRLDERGYLFFVDRKRDTIRVGGENVSSLQVESAVLDHPAVGEVAAVGAAGELGDEVVELFVVAAPDAVLEPEPFFAFLRERLPYFAVPRYVSLLDELPRNAVGRVMKHRLRGDVSARVWDFRHLGLAVARSERR
jgi:crotonobetaine/carnitine-CoA ligase